MSERTLNRLDHAKWIRDIVACSAAKGLDAELSQRLLDAAAFLEAEQAAIDRFFTDWHIHESDIGGPKR